MTDPDAGVRLLTGAGLVLPDRVESATLAVRDGRIEQLVTGPRAVGGRDERIDLTGYLIVPGFVDVHVHGLLGTDVLDEGGAVERVAGLLPQFGVTSFCPTSVACAPAALDAFLTAVADLRRRPPTGARVLGAHVESNFINPEFRGAQPVDCLRAAGDGAATAPDGSFTGRDILAVLDRHRADVRIVTMAPEIPGGAQLLRALVQSGLRVSLGHTGATFEQASDAFASGARQVTHLFNRMSGLAARDPGVAGAALSNEDVAVELICDGRHVHPAMMRVAIAAKGPAKVMAITDATACAGLDKGATARLGGRTITVDDVARLDDGTAAGSVLTMDRAFQTLVTTCDVDMVEAARMCATTPARELGLVGHGTLTPGAIADFVVIDSRLNVVQTWIAGRRVWNATGPDPGTAA
jgi:N-acetylglucosamine-6-phosphate deacetylase